MPVGRLAGLLPATHERAERSPLAQRDDGASVQSQPVHFHFSGFTANLSLASAEIAQLSGRDFSSANLGTHDGQGRNKVRFDKFPQGGKSPQLGKYFCGVIKPTADRRSELSPMKPQLRGAFALQAKSLTYGRRRFDRATAWAFNKKFSGRATRSKPCNSRDGKAAGDARRIATLPGAAARAPIKKDHDARPRGAATKVRTPFRQTRDATLKAAFVFSEQPVTVARGKEPTNHQHTTGAISFSCPVGDDDRHDVRSGHPINFVRVRSGRRDGRRHEPSNF